MEKQRDVMQSKVSLTLLRMQDFLVEEPVGPRELSYQQVPLLRFPPP